MIFLSYCLASPVAFPYPCLTFPCPACFLALPNSLPCLFPWPAHAYFLLPMPTSYAYYLCLLPVSLPCLLLCPTYFLALPISCLIPCPAYFLLPFLALPVSLPCLIPCPAYFLDLSMPTSFSFAYFLCLFPCPAYFCALPISFPCLFPYPAYFRALPIGLLFFMSACCTGI